MTESTATPILLLLAFSLVAVSPVEAQTGQIQGRVSDADTGDALPGATVLVVGATIGAATDQSGQYLMLAVPADSVTIMASFVGYQTERRTVTVEAGQTVQVDFALQEAVLGLETVEVGNRDPVINYGVRTVSGVALQAAGAPDFNTESYAHIDENDFKLVSASPLSTFSIDVDRASYSNVRRFIQDGERPPTDAVRIEEMINYFPYEWGQVAGEHPFAVATEVSRAPWKPEHRLLRIRLHAPPVETEHLPPSNLVFLLDVSGSMDSPDKLQLLKKAFALLVGQLRPVDRVAIVVYAGAAGLVLPSTPGNQQGNILAALERLRAGGTTAGGAGLMLAYETARKHFIDGGINRVILATDGDFNIGPSSDGEMIRLIEKERESGVFITVLGFGTGNLKDSKMEQIADHGNGNFHYVDGLLEARKVLVEEMGGSLLTLAKDVKLQIEFNPAQVAGYRLIGYENRLLNDEDFNDDTKDAGELGAGHTVTALYELVPAGVPVPREEVDDLRYQPQADDPPLSEFEDEMLYLKVRYKDPDGTTSKLLEHIVQDRDAAPSIDFLFATAVAGFGMLLRDSEHAGSFTLDDVLKLAEKGKGDDPRGYRGEFIRLVETVRDLDLLKEDSTDSG